MIKRLRFGTVGVTLLVSAFCVFPAYAEEILKTDPITVEAPLLSYPATSYYGGSGTTPYSDAADYLRALPGITASRFGGHGLEPFIRGQSQGQLNIVSDDAYVFGGCPNRMDPPSAYLNLQPHSEITVVQGYQSVLNGFGGTGGSIIVEQAPPKFGDDFYATGQVQGGYDSNSHMWHTDAAGSAGTSLAYADAYASYKDAGNYDDGDGDRVRAAFEEHAGGLKLGYTPEAADAHLYAGVDYHKTTDALFPGAGMDSPLSEGETFKFGMEQRLDGPVIQNVEASFYAALVDHVMDNFSLRPLTAANPMRVDSESDTLGFKLKSDLLLSGFLVETMAEWRRNNRNAARKVDTSGALQSLLWPGITIDEIGLAAETTYDVAPATRLVIGGRYDYVHVHYGRADEAAPAAANRTPNAIYTQFYGTQAGTKTENNLGGLLRLEHDYNADTLLYAGLSRSVRTADATERGLANFMGATSWVGNPDLDPEKHHQIDAGFDVQKRKWDFGGSVYANFVQDYILRDSARTQPGILVNLPNADIYRNIDAFLGGIDLHGSWQFAPDWTLTGDATYTYGEDTDADRALPQIPPLQGKVGLNWQAIDHLALDTTVRWATQQTRVDTDPLTGSGRDVGKTGGYAVFDLEGTVTALDPVTLNFGVTNLLDKTYANHLNRSNISDPTEIQVNEPGRSFYLQLSVKF